MPRPPVLPREEPLDLSIGVARLFELLSTLRREVEARPAAPLLRVVAELEDVAQDLAGLVQQETTEPDGAHLEEKLVQKSDDSAVIWLDDSQPVPLVDGQHLK